MGSLETFGDVLGILGVIVDVVLFLSPILDIIELCKTKKHEDVSEFMFLMIELTASSYFVNFLRKYDLIALLPNFIGVPANIIFFNIFVMYKYRLIVGILINIASWLVLASYMALLYYGIPNTEEGDLAVSCLATIFCISSVVTTLQKIFYICKDYHYFLLPVQVSFAMFASALCWLIYGIVKDYFELIIPNAVMSSLSVVSISVYFIYKRLYLKKQELEKKTTEENNDNNGNNANKAKKEIVLEPLGTDRNRLETSPTNQETNRAQLYKL
eukprot:TRINITY_DN846_c0_g3_i1.p1 TRINITY_DN846_c0_g3~~TRINITY_DN846_c0_g3_i1.p1  ORF type:complete len:271 (-),score=24.61 TRINITY_DN846_c0_g3_i1:123-935(-)